METMHVIPKKQRLEIKRLRGLFPKSITVSIERSADGGFYAEVKTFPGCVTEADTFSELIEMVNDAVKTYFEIPKRYLPYMPTYLPLLREAQRLDVFPVREQGTELRLELPNRETVAR